MKRRLLSTVTDEEIQIFVKECFNATLLSVQQRTDEEVVCTIRTGGWQLNEKDNPEGLIEDELTLSYGTRKCITVDFSVSHDDEKLWQEFLLMFGFHCPYEDNRFEKYAKPNPWRF